MMIFFMSSTQGANSKLHPRCKLIFSEELHPRCKLFSVIIIRKAPPSAKLFSRFTSVYSARSARTPPRSNVRGLTVPRDIDERNHRCRELKNQARRCTLAPTTSICTWPTEHQSCDNGSHRCCCYMDHCQACIKKS